MEWQDFCQGMQTIPNILLLWVCSKLIWFDYSFRGKKINCVNDNFIGCGCKLVGRLGHCGKANFLSIPQGEEGSPIRNQPQQMIGQATPQLRLGTIRKSTVATTGPQQTPQQQPEVNQCNRVWPHALKNSAFSLLLKEMHYFFFVCWHAQVVVGRGRGRGARGGRMAPQNRQSTQVAESQPSTVSIDGLSSSTTEKQIKNLLNSIGPIQVQHT